ncbi:hypothetical protein DIPPA_29267 [Diplonema papillatum]|nr:hypothetical protein DIPPA_29267 [Diplonema papillatum]
MLKRSSGRVDTTVASYLSRCARLLKGQKATPFAAQKLAEEAARGASSLMLHVTPHDFGPADVCRVLTVHAAMRAEARSFLEWLAPRVLAVACEIPDNEVASVLWAYTRLEKSSRNVVRALVDRLLDLATIGAFGLQPFLNCIESLVHLPSLEPAAYSTSIRGSAATTATANTATGDSINPLQLLSPESTASSARGSTTTTTGDVVNPTQLSSLEQTADTTPVNPSAPAAAGDSMNSPHLLFLGSTASTAPADPSTPGAAGGSAGPGPPRVHLWQLLDSCIGDTPALRDVPWKVLLRGLHEVLPAFFERKAGGARHELVRAARRRPLLVSKGAMLRLLHAAEAGMAADAAAPARKVADLLTLASRHRLDGIALSRGAQSLAAIVDAVLRREGRSVTPHVTAVLVKAAAQIAGRQSGVATALADGFNRLVCSFSPRALSKDLPACATILSQLSVPDSLPAARYIIRHLAQGSTPGRIGADVRSAVAFFSGLSRWVALCPEEGGKLMMSLSSILVAPLGRGVCAAPHRGAGAPLDGNDLLPSTFFPQRRQQEQEEDEYQKQGDDQQQHKQQEQQHEQQQHEQQQHQQQEEQHEQQQHQQPQQQHQQQEQQQQHQHQQQQQQQRDRQPLGELRGNKRPPLRGENGTSASHRPAAALPAPGPWRVASPAQRPRAGWAAAAGEDEHEEALPPGAVVAVFSAAARALVANASFWRALHARLCRGGVVAAACGGAPAAAWMLPELLAAYSKLALARDVAGILDAVRPAFPAAAVVAAVRVLADDCRRGGGGGGGAGGAASLLHAAAPAARLHAVESSCGPPAGHTTFETSPPHRGPEMSPSRCGSPASYETSPSHGGPETPARPTTFETSPSHCGSPASYETSPSHGGPETPASPTTFETSPSPCGPSPSHAAFETSPSRCGPPASPCTYESSLPHRRPETSPSHRGPETSPPHRGPPADDGEQDSHRGTAAGLLPADRLALLLAAVDVGSLTKHQQVGLAASCVTLGAPLPAGLAAALAGGAGGRLTFRDAHPVLRACRDAAAAGGGAAADRVSLLRGVELRLLGSLAEQCRARAGSLAEVEAVVAACDLPFVVDRSLAVGDPGLASDMLDAWTDAFRSSPVDEAVRSAGGPLAALHSWCGLLLALKRSDLTAHSLLVATCVDRAAAVALCACAVDGQFLRGAAPALVGIVHASAHFRVASAELGHLCADAFLASAAAGRGLEPATCVDFVAATSALGAAGVPSGFSRGLLRDAAFAAAFGAVADAIGGGGSSSAAADGLWRCALGSPLLAPPPDVAPADARETLFVPLTLPGSQPPDAQRWVSATDLVLDAARALSW